VCRRHIGGVASKRSDPRVRCVRSSLSVSCASSSHGSRQPWRPGGFRVRSPGGGTAGCAGGTLAALRQNGQILAYAVYASSLSVSCASPSHGSRQPRRLGSFRVRSPGGGTAGCAGGTLAALRQNGQILAYVVYASSLPVSCASPSHGSRQPRRPGSFRVRSPGGGAAGCAGGTLALPQEGYAYAMAFGLGLSPGPVSGAGLSFFCP
jgi:hypothetical protein